MELLFIMNANTKIMNEFKIGDYGEFIFYTRKIDRYGNELKTHFEIRVEIVDIDNQNCLLHDNDGLEYIVKKYDIKKFVPKKKQ
jgi:hypothetical protein